MNVSFEMTSTKLLELSLAEFSMDGWVQLDKVGVEAAINHDEDADWEMID